jgi:hypothetical protein
VKLFPYVEDLRCTIDANQKIICCAAILFNIKAGLTLIPVIPKKNLNVYLQEYITYLPIKTIYSMTL